MNVVDRNVSGSSSSVLSPMIVSRWRTSMPTVLDSALNTVPSSTAMTISTSDAQRAARVATRRSPTPAAR